MNQVDDSEPSQKKGGAGNGREGGKENPASYGMALVLFFIGVGSLWLLDWLAAHYAMHHVQPPDTLVFFFDQHYALSVLHRVLVLFLVILASFSLLKIMSPALGKAGLPFLSYDEVKDFAKEVIKEGEKVENKNKPVISLIKDSRDLAPKFGAVVT